MQPASGICVTNNGNACYMNRTTIICYYFISNEYQYTCEDIYYQLTLLYAIALYSIGGNYRFFLKMKLEIILHNKCVLLGGNYNGIKETLFIIVLVMMAYRKIVLKCFPKTKKKKSCLKPHLSRTFNVIRKQQQSLGNSLPSTFEFNKMLRLKNDLL